jgi:hypothetical protein
MTPSNFNIPKAEDLSVLYRRPQLEVPYSNGGHGR